MQKLNTYLAQANQDPIRLLDFVIQYVDEVSTRNGAKKAIKKGTIKLNGKKAQSGDFVNPGDSVELYEEEPSNQKIFEQTLDIYYEDDYLAIIFKPPGIGVSGNYFRTVQNALPFNIKPSSLADKLSLPRPVHRLDNPTSGLLIIAKTNQANIKLGEMLANKQITKYYHAIVLGEPEYSGKVNSDIDGKIAISEFETIETLTHKRLGQITLIKLSPITGRTHQLRIHMAEIGYPILGDKEYGNEASNKLGKGLFLCATEISFLHPFTKQSTKVSVSLPHKFKKLLNKID